MPPKMYSMKLIMRTTKGLSLLRAPQIAGPGGFPEVRRDDFDFLLTRCRYRRAWTGVQGNYRQGVVITRAA
jgi:hypothetical protein